MLAVGDSMVDPMDVFLADRLRHRARTRAFVRVGSGLSKGGAGWIRRARVQARRLRPYATVVFLGANEGFKMRTPAGDDVTCCGTAWISEYARRVRAMTRAYARGGRGQVLWLTLPAPRAAARRVYTRAVDDSIRAAAKTSTATLVPLDEVFTPGFMYRAYMRWHGRRVRVRHSDGIHLSLRGSEIAERYVERALRLPRR